MKTVNEYKSVLTGIGFTLLISSLAACDRGANPDMNAGNAEVSPGYDAGYEFGFRLALLLREQPDVELDAAFEGLRDALTETGQSISSTEMCASLQPVEIMPDEVELNPESAQPSRTQAGSASFEAGDTGNIEHEARIGSEVTLPSGVQYQVLYKGSGEPPQASDSVHIRYQASLDSGFVIDTSNDKPLQMSLDDVLAPGLKEALLLMNAGARWQVILPPDTAYSRPGNRMLRGREKRTTRKGNLIYDIELVSIDRAQPAKASN